LWKRKKERYSRVWTKTGKTDKNARFLGTKNGGESVTASAWGNTLKNRCYPFSQNKLCQFFCVCAHHEKWGCFGAFSPFRGAKMGQISKCQSAVAGQRTRQRDWP